MTFRDFTLKDGQVHSRRHYDSRELAAAAVTRCGDLLRRLRAAEARSNLLRLLRAGEARSEHVLAGLPPFWVALGLPAEFPAAPGNDLFFCVGAPGHSAFQFNLLLDAGTERTAGLWGLVTALGISYGGAIPAGTTHAGLEETAVPLYNERPLLATALLPVAGAEPHTVLVAADFATCFAAAWLLAGD